MKIFTTVKEPAYQKRVSYQSTLLAGMCCLVAVLIVGGNIATHPRITEALRQDELALLEQVLPAERYNNVLLDDKVSVKNIVDENDIREVYVAKHNGKITGYAFHTASVGYSGSIRLIMGVDANGEIIGVRVISHKETPGLGDKIEIARNDWILSFNGLSLANTPVQSWAVKKDGGQFDQFSGATITPRAVVRAVFQGLEFHKNNPLPAQNKEAKNDE